MNFIQQEAQDCYDYEIDKLNLFSLECPSCSCVGKLVKHAYYCRSIKSQTTGFTGKVELTILRVKCQGCEATHAILPTWIVPYSQHLLEDQLTIIRAYESGVLIGRIEPENPEIDISNVAYIINQYRKHWSQRLLSIFLSLPNIDKIDAFISSCFEGYKRQFMQIKKTTNRLQT
jgi:Domain of unknown function (DUF6431)